MSKPKLNAEQIEAFLEAHFPQAVGFAEILSVGAQEVTLRLQTDAQHVRPGGTVSGPTMMTLADTAMYFLVLSEVGPEALAVTTNLNINFLRRPRPGAMLAQARLLKGGRSLMVGEVYLRTEGDEAPVAHATVTYARPPTSGAREEATASL